MTFSSYQLYGQNYYISACPGCSIDPNDNKVIIFEEQKDSLTEIQNISFKNYLVQDVKYVQLQGKGILIRFLEKYSMKVKDVVYDFNKNIFYVLPEQSFPGYNHIVSNDFEINENGFSKLVYCFFSNKEIKFKYVKLNLLDQSQVEVSPDEITKIMNSKMEYPIYSNYGWQHVYLYPQLDQIKFPVTTDTSSRPVIFCNVNKINENKVLAALTYRDNEIAICDFMTDSNFISHICSGTNSIQWEHQGAVLNYFGFDKYVISLVVERVGDTQNDEPGLNPKFDFDERSEELGIRISPIVEVYNIKQNEFSEIALIENYDNQMSYDIRVLDFNKNIVFYRLDDSIYIYDIEKNISQLKYKSSKFKYMFLKISL